MKKRRRLRERRRAVVATAFEAIFKDTTKRLSWILFVSVNWWCGNGEVGLGFIDEGWVRSFLVLLFLLFNVLPFCLLKGKTRKFTRTALFHRSSTALNLKCSGRFEF